MPEIITALAFDFGLKKIGVAVGESLTKTAKPVAILPAVNNQADFASIGKLIKAWKPNVIVVGMPYNTDGSVQEITVLAQKFADKLEQEFAKKYNFQIATIDESHSSNEAQQIFTELRKNKLIKQGQKIDDIAACIILERWFKSY